MVVFEKVYGDVKSLDEGSVGKAVKSVGKALGKAALLAGKVTLGFMTGFLSLGAEALLKKLYGNLKKYVKARSIQKQPSLKPVCTVNVQHVFALLHAKAKADADEILKPVNGQIDNTAADGNDPKTAVFHSAGEHMITARASDNTKTIDRAKAVEAIQKYVKVFCDEDVDEKFIFPLPSSSEAEKATTVTSADVSESGVFDLTFSRYLAETRRVDGLVFEDGETAAEKPKDGETAAEKPEGEQKPKEEAKPENKPEGEQKPKEEAKPEGEQKPKEEAKPEDKQNKDSAFGYYVLYGLKIKGLKDTTIKDALSRFARNALKGLGITYDHGSGSGITISVKDLVKAGRELFGAIDNPEELAQEVRTKIQKRFPTLDVNECHFRDKSTLIADLDQQQRDGYDGKARQKISSAEYSLCIRAAEGNPTAPLLNRKIIAHIVTMSIKGLYKTFANRIKPDDVVYLRGDGLHTHDDKLMHRLANSILRYSQLKRIIDHSRTNTDALSQLEQKLDKVKTNKDYENSPLCRAAFHIWDAFHGKYNKPENLDKVSIKPTVAFRPLLNKWREFDDEWFGEDRDDMFESADVAYDMTQDLFGGRPDEGVLQAVFEDDPPSGKASLTDAQITKLCGGIQTKILDIANDNAKKGKVHFSPGMANFARVEVGELSGIEDTDAYREYGLGKEDVADAVQKAKDDGYAYFIMAYFKIPKEIKIEDIKSRKKKPVSEVEAIFAESESSIMKKVKLFFQHDRPELNDKAKKDDALKDDVIQAIIGKWTRSKPSADEVKAQVEKYFASPANFGMTWKGTPGYEGFNENNMRKAFEAALPEGGELFGFTRCKPITAKLGKPSTCYYGTKIPADMDVYLAFTNQLEGTEPPSGENEVFFAVSEDRENPDPLKVKDWLNDKKPVKDGEISNDLLNRLRDAAVATLSDDERNKLEFEKWEPDPKSGGKSPNGKDPDGNDGAVVICAKFKKKEPGDPNKEVYFAVSKNRAEPDPKDIDKWLNDSKPVKVPDINDELLGRLKDQAVAVLSEDEKKKLGFTEWIPDPKNAELLVVNGKTPDGSKDAIVVCAKFCEGGDEKVYFAVSNKLESPDPNDIKKWLNDSNSVALSAITPEFLDKMKNEAISAVADVPLSESVSLYEYYSSGVSIEMLLEAGSPAPAADDEVDVGLDSDPVLHRVFSSWVPDPTKPENLKKNAKGPDGKDAVVVCAKFKIEEEGQGGEEEPDAGPEEAQVDLYIIPMPGVKYRHEDENGYEK